VVGEKKGCSQGRMKKYSKTKMGVKYESIWSFEPKGNTTKSN
jgi:hypothetical protein